MKDYFHVPFAIVMGLACMIILALEWYIKG